MIKNDPVLEGSNITMVGLGRLCFNYSEENLKLH